jgi:hypothetical protein
MKIEIINNTINHLNVYQQETVFNNENANSSINVLLPKIMELINNILKDFNLRETCKKDEVKREFNYYFNGALKVFFHQIEMKLSMYRDDTIDFDEVVSEIDSIDKISYFNIVFNQIDKHNTLANYITSNIRVRNSSLIVGKLGLESKIRKRVTKELSIIMIDYIYNLHK